MAYLRRIQSLPRLAYQVKTFKTAPSIKFSEEVLAAKSENKPIVALESTIITHGMPHPQNLETALEVENIVRHHGAVPATVAILKGQLTVGLTVEQLQYLAEAKGVVKTSRRDLAPVIASKLDGATTVAGTIIAADLADIPVFVTGGLGGVHREGETSLDISADLIELGRSRTLVVCSGVKSILDIGRTLEYLETQGVCVCTYGGTADFPAFYCTKSGHQAPYHVTCAEEAARILRAVYQLDLSSGTVVAVPVPQEYAMDENIIDGAIKKALKEAKKIEVKGKEVTPFILSAVAQVTGGASLQTNIALIKSNAKIGAQIAVEFNKLNKTENLKKVGFSTSENFKATLSRSFHTSKYVCNRSFCENGQRILSRKIGFFSPNRECLFVDNNGRFLDIFKRDIHRNSVLCDSGDEKVLANKGDVLVIGGANVDRTYRISEDKIYLDGSTHACSTFQCGGGVGRNMAEALWRLRGGKVRLLTALGDDEDGRYLAGVAPGLILEGSTIEGGRTPSYAAVLDNDGECRLGLGDMVLHQHISTDMVNKHMDVLEKASMVVIDGNIPQTTMDHVLGICHHLDKPVFFEPTDKRKAIKPLQNNHKITYSSPNLLELQAMVKFLKPDTIIKQHIETEDILKLCQVISGIVKNIIVTIGAKGVVLVTNSKNKIHARWYSVPVLETVENVSGAGDCFASGFIHGVLEDLEESQCVSFGFQAAHKALLSKSTVPFNMDNIKPIILKYEILV